MTGTKTTTADPVGRAARLAAELLKSHRLGKRRETAAAAIGRALAATMPKTEHGQLPCRALQPPQPGGHRSAEAVVIWLAARGETPTPGAVAGRLDALQAARGRLERVHEAASEYITADAARAAAHVARVVTATGTGPTWDELAGAMGRPATPAGVREAIIRGLTGAGWLRTGIAPRSLRPGPAARSTT